jgi:hypothetical protein
MYKLDPITVDDVRGVLHGARQRLTVDGQGRGALTQPEILDLLRGPLEYQAYDVIDEAGQLVATKGDVIPRPHADLEAVLRGMKRDGKATFSKQDGGWRLL